MNKRPYIFNHLASCHPTLRHWAKGLCQLCYSKKRYFQDRDKHIANMKKRRLIKGIEYSFTRRNNELIRLYGITLQEYNVLLNKQNNLCWICEQPEKKGTLSVDHCHKTGKIRGLLCRRCNLCLGYLDNNPQLINRIKEYYAAVY